MAEPSDVEARLSALEAIEAVKQLKAKYWRCVDKQLWDEFGTCFSDDATFTVGDSIARGKGEIVRYVKIRHYLPPGPVAGDLECDQEHYQSHLEVA